MCGIWAYLLHKNNELDYDKILKGTSDKAINRVLDKMGLHTNEQIGVFQKNIQKASKRKHLKIVPSKKK